MNVASQASAAKGEMDLKLLLKVLSAVKKGDFSVRMPAESRARLPIPSTTLLN